MSIFNATSQTTGVPWGPLQDPTLQGVRYVSDLLTRGPWAGPYVAPIDPLQTQGIQQGADVASQLLGAGSPLVGGLGQSNNYWQQALQGQGSPWFTNPQQMLGLAGQIAQNPYTDDIIAAAMRDPYRQLVEQQLPSVRMGANMAGQAGGSQEAVLSAIAQRGFQDRLADVGAQVRNANWQQGLGIADQAQRANMLLQQAAAQNLFNQGQFGLGTLQQGAEGLFNWGTQAQALQNQQLQGQMEQFMAPWQVAQSFGSYLNPLAGALQNRSVSEDLTSAYLLQGLGPILSAGGSAAGRWLFGTPGQNGQPGTPGAIGEILKKFKIPGLG
jgi:hypothetical protein